ncbi:hypothetical protein WJX77_012705 [Trebouxia sp. C0004]
MMQQALHEAQARLYQLQKQYDAAYSALEAEPSSDLKKERYQKLDIVLKKAQDAVNSLATTVRNATHTRVCDGGHVGSAAHPDEAGHQQSEVEITLHFRGVEKR